ncbi:MAG: exosortase P [Thermoactinospora sp.]|nr:exosortase P [Thermoactinospora sp.]
MIHLDGRRVRQLALTAVLVAMGAFVLGVDPYIRGWEAMLARTLVGLGASTDTGVNPLMAIVSFNLETGSPVGLQITPECTSAFLALPLLIVTAAIVWLRRRVTVWPLLALVVAVTLMFATNQVRILTVVVLIKGMGYESGYYWGHTMIGSIVSVIGIGLSLAAYAYLVIRRSAGDAA